MPVLVSEIVVPKFAEGVVNVIQCLNSFNSLRYYFRKDPDIVENLTPKLNPFEVLCISPGLLTVIIQQPLL